MSLKSQILKYLEGKDWINGGEIEDFARGLEGFYKPSNASRRARELYNEGKIQREIKNGTVWYRATPKVQIGYYKKGDIVIPIYK